MVGAAVWVAVAGNHTIVAVGVGVGAGASVGVAESGAGVGGIQAIISMQAAQSKAHTRKVREMLPPSPLLRFPTPRQREAPFNNLYLHHLVALGANRNLADRHAAHFGEAADEVLRLFGQILPGARAGDRFIPAGQLFVDRLVRG